MSAVSTRREFLLASGTVLVSGLAGCGGGGPPDAVESGIEDTESQLETADSDLEDGFEAIENENWDECTSAADSLASNAASAKGTAQDAITPAQEGGHTNHVIALGHMVDYAEILIEMADEMEMLCEAGQNGDTEQRQQHQENLQQLDEDRLDKLEQIESALEEIR